MSHPRSEVEEAFAEFRQRGVERHDWSGWAELFTEDALYIEHNLGTFHGREQIRGWIVACMRDFPSMTLAIDWWMIDGDRVAFYIWNMLPDPAGGTREYKFPNTTVLQYAGDGRWSYEEDFYNPHDASVVFREWIEAGGRRDTPPDHTLKGIADYYPQPSSTLRPRGEVEREFERYTERARLAMSSGDWDQWAAQFTSDALYREHRYGVFHGRERILAGIKSGVESFPDMQLVVDWCMVDGNRVSFRGLKRFPDPDGGGRSFEWPVHVILHYAGDGRWSYEEDVYNPEEEVVTVRSWVEAGGRIPPGVVSGL